MAMRSEIAEGSDLGQAIADALGIPDSLLIRRVTFDCDTDGVAIVKIETMVRQAQVEAIRANVRKAMEANNAEV